MTFLFFFLAAVWRYNSHTVQFIRLKCYDSLGFGRDDFLKPEWMVVPNTVMGKMRGTDLGAEPEVSEQPVRYPRGRVTWEIRYSHLGLEMKICE